MSTKKRYIETANLISEQRYLSKKLISEDETNPPSTIKPTTSTGTNMLTNPWTAKSAIDPTKTGGSTLTTNDKTNISSVLWNKINSNEELKTHLGLQPHHTEHNFLTDMSHKIHGHVSNDGHMTLEFPGLGKNHNATLMLGRSFAQHGDSHGDSHGGHSTQSASIPHSSFDVGVKFNLGKVFGGKHSS